MSTRLGRICGHLGPKRAISSQSASHTSDVKEPREESFQGLNTRGFHRVSYLEWGQQTNEKIAICVHGLTRNGHDFDWLSQKLSKTYRVVCPDIVGRGRSEWLPDKAGYGYPQYLNDMVILLNRLLIKKGQTIDWIGTSMGGLLGMMIAAQPGNPIRRLVINDIGGLVPAAGVKRLAGYVTNPPRFSTIGEAVEYHKTILAPFGQLSDEFWHKITLSSIRQASDARWDLRWDPAIGAAFSGEIKDIPLWDIYDKIRCPTLLLRGAESDLLSPETALEMTKRGPKAKLIEIPGCGHAPSLTTESQIAAILDFLKEK